MTTIAVRDGVMAADGLNTGGHVIRSLTVNKIKIIKSTGCAAAGSGATQDVVAWKKWLEAGSPKDDKPELKDFYGLCLSADGSVQMYEERLVPFPIEGEFLAIGHGHEMAMAAMVMGASAVKAIEVASGISVWTGGQITSVTVQDIKDAMPNK